MKLKRLEISNIRTYNEEVIDFEDGITLFEGDIGSGKSTILTAIEFALFGLGDLSGGDVLRMDQQKGHTTLTFEVQGKEYTIHRELLNKNGKIKQENTYIDTPEGMMPLGTTDLKTKILEILNFRESSSPKAHSVIFRYAIYTPQEEMKTILMDEPAKRLETLRKAFSIEEYKTAKDNAEEIQKEIRNDTRFLKEKLKEEDEIKEENKKVSENISEIDAQTKELNETYKLVEDEAVMLRQKLDLENSKKEELLKKSEFLKQQTANISGLKTEIQRIEKNIMNSRENINSNQNETVGLQNKQQEMEKEIIILVNKISELQQEKKPELEEENLKKQMANVETEISKAMLQSGAASNEILNLQKLINNQICPTCSQNISAETFNEKLDSRKSEKLALDKKMNLLQEEKRELDAKKENLRNFKKIQEEILSMENLLKSKNSQKETLAAGLKRIAESIQKIKKEIDENNVLLEEKRKILETTPELSAQREAIEQQLSSLNIQILVLKKQEDELQIKTRNIHGEIKSLESQKNSSNEILKKNTEKLMELEWMKTKKERLDSFAQWIEEYFIEAIDAIEKHVLSSINQRFNVLFSGWFKQLLENSDINVQIDEAFTPVITQGDWVQTITSLSGGEKTSVALAYRLALNSIIRELSASDTYSLMILDEPTDGFSKEQLLKVQDVLKSTGCNQIILVSHETELECCADNIYRIEKRGRVSGIQKI